jgi:hypothetical protein
MLNIWKWKGLLLAVLLAGPWPALAWGPITHAYIAAQAIPNAPPAALFGAMCADMNDFNGWNEKLGSKMKGLTHFNADLVVRSPFQLGLLTHNSSWGGDSYAHAYFHVPTDKLYPLRVYEQLSQETGITMNEAEDFIETIMDFVICRDLDAAFAARIVEAADAVGETEEHALVDAFAEPLTKEMPELSHDQATDAIRMMFQCDKLFLKRMGELSAMPAELFIDAAPRLLAAGSGMDVTKARRCVQRGIELCADWRAHLDEQSREIAAKMRALGLIAE